LVFWFFFGFFFFFTSRFCALVGLISSILIFDFDLFDLFDLFISFLEDFYFIPALPSEPYITVDS